MSRYIYSKIKKLWDDGSAIDQKTADLKEHIADCADCQEGMYLWQNISAALHEKDDIIHAPDGFAARVTACLAQEKYKLANSRKKSIVARLFKNIALGQKLSLFNKYRYAMAAVVTCLIVLAVSFSFADRHWWYSVVADKPEVVIENEEAEKSAQPVDKNSQLTVNQPPKAGGSSSSTDGQVKNQPVEEIGEKTTGSNKTEVKNKKRDTQESQIAVNPVEPKVFLNHQQRVIESTLLKLQVADLTGVKQKVCAVADASSIGYYSFGRQHVDGQNMEILRFVVPQNKGSSFIEQIKTNGKVLDCEEEKRDISNQFAETLDQYQKLVAKRNELVGQEAQELDRQIVALEQQLTEWDKEAWQQVVVLWLVE